MTPDETKVLITLIGTLIVAVVSSVTAIIIQRSKSSNERTRIDVALAELRPNGGDSIKDQINKMQGRQQAHHEQAVAADIRMDGRITNLWEEGHTVVRNLTRQIAEADHRVSTVDERVEAVDEKVEAVDEKVEQYLIVAVGEKVDTVGDQVDKVSHQVESVSDKIDEANNGH